MADIAPYRLKRFTLAILPCIGFFLLCLTARADTVSDFAADVQRGLRDSALHASTQNVRNELVREEYKTTWDEFGSNVLVDGTNTSSAITVAVAQDVAQAVVTEQHYEQTEALKIRSLHSSPEEVVAIEQAIGVDVPVGETLNPNPSIKTNPDVSIATSGDTSVSPIAPIEHGGEVRAGSGSPPGDATEAPVFPESTSDMSIFNAMVTSGESTPSADQNPAPHQENQTQPDNNQTSSDHDVSSTTETKTSIEAGTSGGTGMPQADQASSTSGSGTSTESSGTVSPDQNPSNTKPLEEISSTSPANDTSTSTQGGSASSPSPTPDQGPPPTAPSPSVPDSSTPPSGESIPASAATAVGGALSTARALLRAFLYRFFPH